MDILKDSEIVFGEGGIDLIIPKLEKWFLVWEVGWDHVGKYMMCNRNGQKVRAQRLIPWRISNRKPALFHVFYQSPFPSHFFLESIFNLSLALYFYPQCFSLCSHLSRRYYNNLVAAPPALKLPFPTLQT